MNAIRIAKNSGAMFAARVITRILDFIFFVYIARTLGPEQFGYYNLLTAIVVIFALFADLGQNSVLQREIAQNRAKFNALIFNSLILNIFVAGCLLILCAFTILHVDAGQYLTFPVIIIFCTGILFSSRYKSYRVLLEVVFYVDFAIWIIMAINIIERILLLVCLLGFLNPDSGLIGVLLCIAGVDLIGFMLTLFVLRREFGFRRTEIDFKIIRPLIPGSIFILLTALFDTFNVRIDIVLLRIFADNQTIGYYSSAVRTVESINFIHAAFMASMFPILAEKYSVNQDAFERVYAQSVKYLLIMILGLILFFVLNAKEIILPIFGDKYGSSVDIMKVFVFSEIALFVWNPFFSALIIQKKEKLCLVFTAVAALTNIALNVVLIPRFGGLGAAYSSVISYSVYIVPGLLFPGSRHLARLLIEIAVKPIAVFCIVFVLMAYGLKNQTLLNVILPMPLFIGGIVLLKIFDETDQKYLRNIFAAIRK